MCVGGEDLSFVLLSLQFCNDFCVSQTSNLLLPLSQMKTSPSNTTEPSCCPWPTAGKTPTAHSFLCEWHRANRKLFAPFFKPAPFKMLGCFDCFYFFVSFFFFLLAVPFSGEKRCRVRCQNAEKNKLWINSFSPTHVTFFFSCRFLCKIYRNSSILLCQGNVSPRLCFSLFS